MALAEPRELYLLVLRFLEGTPCVEAFEVLRREAEAHGLFGERTAWTGARARASYEDASSASGGLPPPEHLQGLLSQLLALSQSQCPPDARLEAPPLTLLSRGHRSLITAPAGPAGGAGRSNGLVCVDGASGVSGSNGGRRLVGAASSYAPPPFSELWSRHYLAAFPPAADAACRVKPAATSRPAAFVPTVLAREVGARPRPLRCLYEGAVSSESAGSAARRDPAGGQTSSSGAEPTRRVGGVGGGRFRALAAFRGHLCAAYCVMYDVTGRRILTGADDGNVKVVRRLRPRSPTLLRQPARPWPTTPSTAHAQTPTATLPPPSPGARSGVVRRHRLAAAHPARPHG